MAEKLSTSTFDINHPRKRRLVEEKFDVTPATLYIERIDISKSPNVTTISEQQFSIASREHKEEEITEICSQGELMLNIPILDQYVHILSDKQKAWRLQDCSVIFMSDFDVTNGEVLLTKKRVLIETSLEICLSCHQNSCLHYQAYDMCLEFQSLALAESKSHADGTYFTIDANTIFLIKNGYHCFYMKERKWYCDNCSGLCVQKSTLQKILSEYIDQIPIPPKVLDYSTISTRAIPFKLSKNLANIYSEQLTQGILLPINLKSDISFCEQGHKYSEKNLVAAKKGIIIYTENDILDLKEHIVYTTTCEGKCNCKVVFEGDKYLLLNINNRYFIHYGVLYEYSEFMTMSRNTLHGYMRAKNNKFHRMGRELSFSYHILQHGWNGYLRMLDINYTNSFICPRCRDAPEILVLDGITMGTIKELPDSQQEYDEDQRYPLVPMSKRVFISDLKNRKNVREYCANGFLESTFHAMISSLKFKEFTDYLIFTNSVREELYAVDYSYPNAKVLIELLSRAEPITGLFPISILDNQEMKAIVQLSHGTPIDPGILFEICGKIYTFKLLINSFCEVNEQLNTAFTLHPLLAGLLRAILFKIEALNTHRDSRKLVEAASYNNFIQYFPAIARRYRLPIYEDENEEKHIKRCTKIYPKHQRLSPGLLVLVCKHKVCYGFEILRFKESTTTVFNLLLTLFQTPPRIIIYDNACNLHNTCIIRDPQLFKDTTFLVDRFHWKNHCCNPSYSLKSVKSEDFKRINSQVCEQLFSTLRRISTQISFMRIENVFYNVRYFLYCLNKQELEKLK